MWLQPTWEDTLQRWYNWLYEMKKKDEEKRKEKEHPELLNRMVCSAEGGTGLLHTITKQTVWRGGKHILNEEEERDVGAGSAGQAVER